MLSQDDIIALHCFFSDVAYGALRALVPGGHVLIASNPLLSSMTFHAFQKAGFEKRGEIIRLVQTLRGGYKPKGSEADFPDVSVMPRSCWEPWGLFRKPFDGTVAGESAPMGHRRLSVVSKQEPLKDVITCSPTRASEKGIAPHPWLKPQRFLRHGPGRAVAGHRDYLRPVCWRVNRRLRQLMLSDTGHSGPTVILSIWSRVQRSPGLRAPNDSRPGLR